MYENTLLKVYCEIMQINNEGAEKVLSLLKKELTIMDITNGEIAIVIDLITFVFEFKSAVQGVVAPVETTGIFSEEKQELLETAETEENCIANAMLDLKIKPTVAKEISAILKNILETLKEKIAEY